MTVTYPSSSSPDVLGPASVNAVTTRPARVVTRGAAQTWFKNCTSSLAQDGTQFGADWFNDMQAQFLEAFTGTGITQDGGDDMLLRAIQSVGVRYGIDTASGAAPNNLIVSFTPPVTAMITGTLLVIKAANAPTSSCTLAANALAAAALQWGDGNPVGAGDWNAGDDLFVVIKGAIYELVSVGRRQTGPTPQQHGQCYLYLTGGNVVLMPKNGNGLIINGSGYTVPSAGIALSPSGFTGLTYIHAVQSGGVMSLVGSATGHATSTANGVETLSGDATRTLVGMAYASGGSWTQCLSWFNRVWRRTRTALSSNVSSTTNGSFIEISTALRNSFLAWPDEPVLYQVSAPVASNNTNTFNLGGAVTAIAFDGGSVEQPLGWGALQCSTSITMFHSHNFSGIASLSEGQHQATLMGMASNGGGYATVWFGGTSNNNVPGGAITTLDIIVRG